jgi:hypothetical protein
MLPLSDGLPAILDVPFAFPLAVPVALCWDWSAV